MAEEARMFAVAIAVNVGIVLTWLAVAEVWGRVEERLARVRARR